MWAVYLEYQISVLIIFKWIYLLEAFIHFSQCCTVIVWSLYWYLILNKSAILFFDANKCTILFSFCKTISWCIVMFLCMHEKLQFWSCCWQKLFVFHRFVIFRDSYLLFYEGWEFIDGHKTIKLSMNRHDEDMLEDEARNEGMKKL